MNPHSAINSPLAMLVIGVLFGILLGASDLGRPVVISAGVIGALYVGGRFLLPVILRKNPPLENTTPASSGRKENTPCI